MDTNCKLKSQISIHKHARGSTSYCFMKLYLNYRCSDVSTIKTNNIWDQSMMTSESFNNGFYM